MAVASPSLVGLQAREGSRGKGEGWGGGGLCDLRRDLVATLL